MDSYSYSWLDLCVRTQCWDGSFLDGRRGARTVTSGEYTYGFTLYGLVTGYLALKEARAPQLDEILTIGPTTLRRREFYQRMFYRAAMSRAGIALPADYRDDIISGNTLITGANRVLGYAIGMRMVADALTEEAQKPDGTMRNDFRIEVGEYPKTVGVPIRIESPDGTVLATAVELSGWPRLLPETAELTVSAAGERVARCRPGEPVRVAVRGPTMVTVEGPEITLPPEAGGQTVPFRARFELEPAEPGRVLAVMFRVLRGTIPYEHQFVER